MPLEVTVAEQTGTLTLLTLGISGYEEDALKIEPTYAAFRDEIKKVAALKECWRSHQ